MKIVLVIFCWLFCICIKAQSITIKYSKTLKSGFIHTEELTIKDSVTYYWITMGRDKKLFKKNNPLGKEFCSHSCYVNYKTKEVINQSHLMGLKKITYSDTLINEKWVISNETKTILNHICTKASLAKENIDIEVWFTKELNLVGSPFAYGLPGVVLEIKNKIQGSLISAISIENSNIEIMKPSSDYEMTKNEYQDYLMGNKNINTLKKNK